MNETSEAAWFYTREGERIGPVSLADLRVLVVESRLHPRLDMVWTQGMADWKAAGEIDGLFERRTPQAIVETSSPTADPYRPPMEESAADFMSRQTDWPGMRRRSFWILILFFPVLLNFVFAWFSTMLAEQFDARVITFISLGVTLAIVVLAIVAGLQRLANLGMSRWWYLGNFVPILNLWIGYRCFCCPAGYAFHKKMDGIGIFTAILYWLANALILLVFIMLVVALLGAAGSPEIQEKIREFIETNSVPQS